MKLLLVGLGGGILPMFLHRHFTQVMDMLSRHEIHGYMPQGLMETNVIPLVKNKYSKPRLSRIQVD